MSAPARRKGWCPGALRPMPAADGLLVRVRLSCRRLDPASAEALADCASEFGNGEIEFSSRANLQLRGIRQSTLQDLQRRLGELGLLDADAVAEGVRNIVASPLSDIDPDAVIDVGPIVAALEARLHDALALRHLPAKFGFLIDGGGALPLGDVEADIRFEACGGEGDPRFAVKLAGAEDVAGVCEARQVPDVAARLASAFLAGRYDCDDAPRRMRGLVAQRGAAAIFAAAGLPALTPLSGARRIAILGDILGAHRFGASSCVGAAAPLGRLSAAGLRALAQQAPRACARDLRLTPWRTLVITGLDDRGARELAAALGGLGFILDPRDRRLRVVACAGAPACANAARPVQSEALEFAAAIPPGCGIALHVSGCEKGCGHGRAAPLTLIARAAGYDLVADGKASDKPSRLALSKDAVMSLLARSREAVN